MADREIIDSRAAVRQFAQVVSDSESFTEQLAESYNQMRTALAFQFQRMARRDLPPPSPTYDTIREQITSEMRSVFGNAVEESLLLVRGYTSPHPALYALLLANVGNPVPGWRLRVLTADAVHTERRTRELRDLGFDLETSVADEENYYRLAAPAPDLRYAAAFQLRRNAVSSKLTGQRLAHVIGLAEAAAQLPQRRKATGD